MVLCLGEPPRGFCDVGCCCCFPHRRFFIHFLSSIYCCSSFIFVLHFVVVVLHFISRLLFHVTDTPPWLLRPVKASTSSELYPGYFRLLYFCQAFPSQLYRERYGFEWAFFTHRRFLPYAPSPTFLTQPAFIKASLGAGSSSLKFAGLHTDPQNTDLAHLFF